MQFRAPNSEALHVWMAHIAMTKERLRKDPLAHIKEIMAKQGRRNAVFKVMDRVDTGGSEGSLMSSAERKSNNTKPHQSKTAKAPKGSDSHPCSKVSILMSMYSNLMQMQHTLVQCYILSLVPCYRFLPRPVLLQRHPRTTPAWCCSNQPVVRRHHKTAVPPAQHCKFNMCQYCTMPQVQFTYIYY